MVGVVVVTVVVVVRVVLQTVRLTGLVLLIHDMPGCHCVVTYWCCYCVVGVVVV